MQGGGAEIYWSQDGAQFRTSRRKFGPQPQEEQCQLETQLMGGACGQVIPGALECSREESKSQGQ